MLTVSIVLPCLNEEESVGDCVDEARTAVEAAGWGCDVVVVDNGSTDGSVAAAEAHGARVITESRRGYGRALRTGIEQARGEIVVMADADLTYPLHRVAEIVEPVANGSQDMVVGERLSGVARGAMPWLHRYVGTPALSYLVSRAGHGIPVRDSQSGFRAFRRDAAMRIGLRTDGMEFASELLIRAARHGWRIKTLPTGYRMRIGESKLNTMSDGWRHLQLILLLAPHLLLVTPGVILSGLGAILAALSLARPAGINVGSLSWQPVFFSGIALILGVQATLAGAVLAHRSGVVDESVHRHYAFVGRRGFSRSCATFGGLAALFGILIDFVLFIIWVGDSPSPANSLALASLAQSLIVAGATVAGFGVVNALLARNSSAAIVADAESVDALPPPVPAEPASRTR